MSLNIIKTSDNEEIANFVVSSINSKLKEKKKVLWLVCGGSSIPLEILISKKINFDTSNNLVISLTDERFGPVGHKDSNLEKLLDGGFVIHKAKLVPFLINKDMRITKEEINKSLTHEFNKADYKIGIFGIGIDGHVAGILPHTEAVKNIETVCTYETDIFNRVTITPSTINKLDEAVLYAMGENKWPVLELLEKELLIDDCPAQILKKVPLLTIFTDYK